MNNDEWRKKRAQLNVWQKRSDACWYEGPTDFPRQKIQASPGVFPYVVSLFGIFVLEFWLLHKVKTRVLPTIKNQLRHTHANRETASSFCCKSTPSHTL